MNIVAWDTYGNSAVFGSSEQYKCISSVVAGSCDSMMAACHAMRAQMSFVCSFHMCSTARRHGEGCSGC